MGDLFCYRMLCWASSLGGTPGVSVFRSFPLSGVIFLTSFFSLLPRGYMQAARFLGAKWEGRLRGLSTQNRYGHSIPLNSPHCHPQQYPCVMVPGGPGAEISSRELNPSLRATQSPRALNIASQHLTNVVLSPEIYHHGPVGPRCQYLPPRPLTPPPTSCPLPSFLYPGTRVAL